MCFCNACEHKLRVAVAYAVAEGVLKYAVIRAGVLYHCVVIYGFYFALYFRVVFFDYAVYIFFKRAGLR